jgi:hypothetical protein
MAILVTPHRLNLSMALAVSSGVALGVTFVRRPRPTDKIEQVGALERIAAGEYHERVAKGADLIEQAVSLVGVQLVRVAAGHGRCAAVHTR